MVGWLKILVTAQVLGFGIWIGLWPQACQKALFFMQQDRRQFQAPTETLYSLL